MNKIATILIGMAVVICAYEVELEGLGTVDIPDGVCDTGFVERFVDEFNDYEFNDIYQTVQSRIGSASYSMDGDPVVAMHNFYSATSFNPRVFIRGGNIRALGWYSPQNNYIVINAQYLYRHSREKLLYIIIHESTHDIQFEEGRMDEGTDINRVINEIFADATAIRSVISLTGCDPINAVALRQPTRVLSQYIDVRSRATATIIIDHIIMEQSYNIAIGN